MKNLFLVTLLSLAPLAASASREFYRCSDVDGSRDPIRAEVNLGYRTARIFSTDTESPVLVAALNCGPRRGNAIDCEDGKNHSLDLHFLPSGRIIALYHYAVAPFDESYVSLECK